MKWFFALCNTSKDCKRTMEHLKIAVNSAKQNTNLEPYFLYDGEEDELTEWLTSKGINVFITQVSFLDTLLNNPKFESKGTARGAYLRVEVPKLIKKLKLKDKFILYTDCDVIFTETSTDIFNYTPEYFVAAPEFKADDWSYFNSGVMLINVDNMYNSRQEFVDYIKKECKNIQNGQHDQPMYNQFYKDKYEKLDPIYNWKPYWGHNPNAKIIHFHGPKIDTIQTLQDTKTPPILMYLYYIGQENGKGYDHYKKLFDDYKS